LDHIRWVLAGPWPPNTLPRPAGCGTPRFFPLARRSARFIGTNTSVSPGDGVGSASGAGEAAAFGAAALAAAALVAVSAGAFAAEAFAAVAFAAEAFFGGLAGAAV
jgi:hypothetical protein